MRTANRPQGHQQQAQNHPAPNQGAKCFMPNCTSSATSTTVVQVAPGVETDLPICTPHEESLNNAKKEAATKAENSRVVINIERDDDSEDAPFGRCHVCDLPVGVFTMDLLMDRDATSGDEVAVKWWVHASQLNNEGVYVEDGKTSCHPGCGCRTRAQTGYVRAVNVITVPN
jgi:hypothetical protein